jgi:hypothetical protein
MDYLYEKNGWIKEFVLRRGPYNVQQRCESIMERWVIILVKEEELGEERLDESVSSIEEISYGKNSGRIYEDEIPKKW